MQRYKLHSSSGCCNSSNDKSCHAIYLTCLQFNLVLQLCIAHDKSRSHEYWEKGMGSPFSLFECSTLRSYCPIKTSSVTLRTQDQRTAYCKFWIINAVNGAHNNTNELYYSSRANTPSTRSRPCIQSHQQLTAGSPPPPPPPTIYSVCNMAHVVIFLVSAVPTRSGELRSFRRVDDVGRGRTFVTCRKKRHVAQNKRREWEGGDFLSTASVGLVTCSACKSSSKFILQVVCVCVRVCVDYRHCSVWKC